MLLDVQADPEQDERPQHHGKQRRNDLPEPVQMREVVMPRRHDHTDDDLDDEQNLSQHAPDGPLRALSRMTRSIVKLGPLDESGC